MTKCNVALTAIAIITLSIMYGSIAAHYIIMPIQAASTSDTAIMPKDSGSTSSNSNTDKPKLSASGSTEVANNATVAKTLVLTAIPDKAAVKAGATETIHIRAAMENGTGISNATIESVIIDYVTAKQKVVLGGNTDKKGNLDIAAAIGPHAKPGQFVAVINGTSGDLHKTISTGFVVAATGKGSSSSSSSGSSSGKTDSKGRCSGSSCK